MGDVVDDSTGTPLTAFRVRMDDHHGGTKRFLGDAHDGRFDWPLSLLFCQAFALEVEADGYAAFLTDTRSCADSAIQTYQIRLHPASEIAGIVVAPSGEPVVNAFAGLNGDGFGCMLVHSRRQAGFGARTQRTRLAGRSPDTRGNGPSGTENTTGARRFP